MGVLNMSPSIVRPEAIGRARELRRSMTQGERRLWAGLRDLRTAYGVHVRRQVPIGPFIADFAIHSAKLVIEVDGQFHVEGDGLARDARRDAWLNDAGYRVLRFSTGDVAEAVDGCIEWVLHELGLMN